MDWLQNCSVLDYLFIGFALFLVVRGFIIGCAGQLGSLAGLFVAAILLFSGRGWAIEILRGATSLSEDSLPFQAIVLVVMTAVSISAWLLVRAIVSRLLHVAIPQPANSILGGVTGAVEGVLLLVSLCTFGVWGDSPTQKKEEDPFLEKNSSLVKIVSPWIEPFTAKPGRMVPSESVSQK